MRAFHPILLTLSALLGLGTMVYFLMRFATGSLHLPIAYWLVPLFGAIGGAVASIRNNEKKLVLSVIEKPDKIQLGVVGDICVGLGGACAIVFLFGNTLQIDPEANARSAVLLISVSFLAGVFGNKIIDKAGRELMNELADVKREAAKIEATQYADAARDLIERREVNEALESSDKALKLDPNNIGAHFQKARALRHLGKVEEALATINEALGLQPDETYEAECLYNRACYMAILGKDIAQILADLKKSFRLVPATRNAARKDSDFESIRHLPEFKNLVGNGEVSTT